MVTTLLSEIRACRICEKNLPLGPNPVISFSKQSKILIVGQAPGTRVHETGIPWNDPSGDRLRDWLGISKKVFYDKNNVAIVPMGFCYPGKGKSGDLPPRPECVQTWMKKILDVLKNREMTLLIGKYAQEYFLGTRRKKNLTLTVQNWREYTPGYLVLPHPSPRNNIWLKKNEWFEEEELPFIRQKVKEVLKG